MTAPAPVFVPVALACSVVALLAAGCGSSDTATNVSKAAYIAKADAICTDFKKKVQPLSDQLRGARPRNAKEFENAAKVFQQVVDEARAELAAIQRLTPPPGDEAAIKGWLDAGKQSQVLGQSFVTTLESGDKQKISAITSRGNSASARARSLAARYGMKVCSTPLQ